jgi:general nucleoside transport system permease protein
MSQPGQEEKQPVFQSRLPAWLVGLAAPLVGALLGLIIGAFLIALTGNDPLHTYGIMLQGAFGGSRQLTETILKTGPLLLVGLGLTAAFRARVWNIGGEGQFYMGALFGGLVALSFPQLPAIILIPLMLAAGAIGGMLWGFLPALLKVKRGMNEIISTLMLNYVAFFLMEYLVRGPLKEPGGFLPVSAQFEASARLPLILGSRIHIGIPLVILVVPAVYFLLWRTPIGFKLRAVGSKVNAARYAGIDVGRVVIFALMFSGALAGLAGIIEVSTLHTRLRGGISGGYGFSGILVALLGRMHPLGVVAAAIFFGALLIGAQSMRVILGLPPAIADVIQAVIVLSVLGVDALARRKLVS